MLQLSEFGMYGYIHTKIMKWKLILNTRTSLYRIPTPSYHQRNSFLFTTNDYNFMIVKSMPINRQLFKISYGNMKSAGCQPLTES